jgi:hypothetical protein
VLKFLSKKKIIIKIFKDLFNIVPKNSYSLLIKKYLLNKKRKKNHNYNNKKIYKIAVQGVYDLFYQTIFAAIVTDLWKKKKLINNIIIVNSINHAAGTGLIASILRSQFVTFLRSLHLARFNSELVGPVAYNSNEKFDIINEILIFLYAKKIWKKLIKKNNINNFKINNVFLGDLIVDTYLRYKPSYVFKISDPFVEKIIRQALRDLQKSSDFFRITKPDLYLTSSTVYLEHGIATRVAAKFGVKVRSYHDYHIFGKKITLKDYHPTITTQRLPKNFFSHQQRKKIINLANKNLNQIILGSKSDTLFYMKRSAYKNYNKAFPDLNGAVVIFTHDFFDSPHVHSNFIFEDFYKWLDFTIKILSLNKIPFFIKPHPNKNIRGASDAAFKSLKKKYPGLKFISSKISNLQIVQKGIICGVSVFGTVIHELAYMGVPSIACARHPSYLFQFCRTASSLNEYKKYLCTPNILPISRKEMKKQACEFFYMRNLHGTSHELNLNKNFINYYKHINFLNSNSKILLKHFFKLINCKGWKGHIRLISKEIETNKLTQNILIH